MLKNPTEYLDITPYGQRKYCKRCFHAPNSIFRLFIVGIATDILLSLCLSNGMKMEQISNHENIVSNINFGYTVGMEVCKKYQCKVLVENKHFSMSI